MADQNRKHSEENITRLLESFQPQPGERFFRRMNTAPWMSGGGSLTSRPVLRKWLPAAAALILLGAAIMLITPGGRATAVRLFEFFLSSGGDQQVLRVTPPGTEGPNIFASKDYFSLTIDEAESRAGFNVLQPEVLPEGLTFTGARYDPDLDAVTLLYQRGGEILLVTQRKLGTVNEIGSIGASAVVEDVQVRGQTGEFVRGGWRTLTGTVSPYEQTNPDAPVDLGMEWDTGLEQSILRWEEGEFAFQIVASGMEEFHRETMLSFAEGMSE